MGLVFEWDNNKAETNVLKHSISFEEASTVLGDNRSITIDDVPHSFQEKRYVTLGLSSSNRVLVVVHTARAERVRIISARKASRKEKKQYETI